MRSSEMLSNPASRRVCRARRTSSGEARRSSSERSFGRKLCAPSETRFTPPARSSRASSGVTVSGFASTVSSSASASASSNLASSPGAVKVGVPPPRKIVSSLPASTPRSSSSSARSASTYAPCCSSRPTTVTKSQYPQRCAQKGRCTYRCRTGAVITTPRFGWPRAMPRPTAWELARPKRPRPARGRARRRRPAARRAPSGSPRSAASRRVPRASRRGTAARRCHTESRVSRRPRGRARGSARGRAARPFRRQCPPPRPGGLAPWRRRRPRSPLALVVEVEDGEERLLRHLHAADLLHPLLAFLLPLEQFAFPGDVAAVALRENVLAPGLDRLPRDHAGADGRLHGHVEHLTRDLLTQALDELTAAVVGGGAVDDERERVDLLPADEDVDAAQVARAEACDLVVEARIASRARLQLVVEIEHDLAEGKLVDEEHALLAQVLEVVEAASALVGELHDRPDVVLRHDHRGLHVRLLDELDLLRHLRRVVDLDDLAGPLRRLVRDVRRRDQEVEVELPLEALAHDLHVQEPEEAAAEPEAERLRRLRLVRERGVVELQALEGVA